MRKGLVERLLIELMRNSKASDRKLAKKLGVSQPTITRTRIKIEREGIIKDYTIIPNWEKLGFIIMAFTLVKMNPKVVSKELVGKLKEYAATFPDVFFASTGEGMGMTGVIMSLHKSYRDYARKLAKFRQDWGQLTERVESFITVTNEGVVKDFSFKYFTEDLL